jgi:hypothetical protein
VEQSQVLWRRDVGQRKLGIALRGVVPERGFQRGYSPFDPRRVTFVGSTWERLVLVCAGATPDTVREVSSLERR